MVHDDAQALPKLSYVT